MREAEELGARAMALEGDLADTASHERLLDAAEAALGPLDCLINNAGVSVLARGQAVRVDGGMLINKY